MKLLLAEDNLPDALLIREVIRNEKLPVELAVASDGEQAADIFTRAELDPLAPCPDILLLDINLPKIDGFAVLRKIRQGQRCKDIPVLVVTSSDSPGDRNEAARLGASYFRKPVNYEEYLKIGDVLRQFLEDNDLL